MNSQELANDIAVIPFFKGMNDRHIRILAGCACRIHFEKGTIIFHQGETANRFYLIADGTIELEAALESGERRIVAGAIGRGGVLGWSWLFPPYEWQFTARALTQTYALFFYGTVLREHCQTDPSLGFELFKRMGTEMVTRLQSARSRLLEAETAGFSPVGRACHRQRKRSLARTGSIMLHSIQERYGEKLRATDGEIGHVRDFYFDDKNWAVRYLVADTGRWLTGRLVLISPHALGHLYPHGKVLLVNLTREQIERSPSIDEHKPVSRQHEEEYHRHYGYPYYADSMPLWGLAGYPVVVPPPPPTVAKQQGVDSHLRSARVVSGYNVEASDGAVGEIVDFLIDGRTWVLREIMVESGHWYSGKEIRIPTGKISRISYTESTIYVDSTKAAIIKTAQGLEEPHAGIVGVVNLFATTRSNMGI